MYKGPNQHKL